MVETCVNVCTRTLYDDYMDKGSCGKSFHQIMRETPHWADLIKLIESTVPTVLLLEDNLYVTGIPTDRKDKVGTPIRWNFHLRSQSAGKYFAPLVQAFSNGRIEQLGKNLDKLCGAEGNNNFTPPEDAKALEKILPAGMGKPADTFLLWTKFCPTDREELAAFIDGLDIPEGNIEIEGVINKKKNRSSPQEETPLSGSSLGDIVDVVGGVFSSGLEQGLPILTKGLQTAGKGLQYLKRKAKAWGEPDDAVTSSGSDRSASWIRDDHIESEFGGEAKNRAGRGEPDATSGNERKSGEETGRRVDQSASGGGSEPGGTKVASNGRELETGKRWQPGAGKRNTEPALPEVIALGSADSPKAQAEAVKHHQAEDLIPDFGEE